MLRTTSRTLGSVKALPIMNPSLVMSFRYRAIALHPSLTQTRLKSGRPRKPKRGAAPKADVSSMQGGLPDAIELDNTSRASSGGEGNSNNGWDNERREDPGRNFFEFKVGEVKRCENGRLGLFANGEFQKYADADEDSDEFRYCMALALQSMGFMKDPRN